MILRNLHIVGEDDGKKDIITEDEIISEVKSSDHSNNTDENITIDFKNCIAFPGLVNSHDHLEFNLYPQLGHKVYKDYVEWGNDIHLKDKKVINSIESIPAQIRVKYGIIKNLLCGVTAVAHHGDYHSCLDDSPITVIKNCTSIHSVKLGSKFKLKLNWIKNLEPYVIHAGEGINSESYEEVNQLIKWNIFKRKIIGVHGIAMTAEQSKSFAAVVWCPVSNLFLFNKTAEVNTLKHNTKILFGSDSTLTADWNFLEQLRVARELKLLSDKELFESITTTASDVWGLTGMGNISEGRIADIVIAKNKEANSIVSFFQTDPEDIVMIIKNGKVILFDDSIKELILKEVKHINNFDSIGINRKIKFVKYKISEIINEIKKYNSSISLPLK